MSGNFARQTGMTRPAFAAKGRDRMSPMGPLSRTTLPVARTIEPVEPIRWDSPDLRPIRLTGHRTI